jgi:hypothetical protein
LVRLLAALCPSKARFSVSISYSTQPKEKIAARVHFPPFELLGRQYCTVPTICTCV